MEEDIEKLIKELTKVRPEMLNEEALKLFNTIIAIIDERDYLLKAYKQDEKMIDELIEYIDRITEEIAREKGVEDFEFCDNRCADIEDYIDCNDCIKEYFRKKVETNE